MKIFLTGVTGQVGSELHRILGKRYSVISPNEHELDLSNTERTRTLLRDSAPDLVINSAAYTDVDGAEGNRDLAHAINVVAPRVLAEEASRLNIGMIHFSTDYVFDGEKGSPYSEQDAVSPLNWYGRSKLAGEKEVLDVGNAMIILRLSWVYSLAHETNFIAKLLKWASHKETLRIVADQVSTPTWGRYIAESTSKILEQSDGNPHRFISDNAGLYHLACSGYCSRYEWALEVLRLMTDYSGSAPCTILPAASGEFLTPALRPKFTALDCSKLEKQFGLRLHSWKDVLARAIVERYGFELDL